MAMADGSVVLNNWTTPSTWSLVKWAKATPVRCSQDTAQQYRLQQLDVSTRETPLRDLGGRRRGVK